MGTYIGRFAPSPTGPLHAGSLTTALASWLDARAHGGQWLLRIEDIDASRCSRQHADTILQQLHACQLLPDGPVLWQSGRHGLYRQALQQLLQKKQAYPCACTRKDIEHALNARGIHTQKGQTQIYPGSCRPENGGLHGQAPRSWRLHLQRCGCPASIRWYDRRLGWQEQKLLTEVGDFILKRADGLWAYQLAVVVDDAAQGITHVVRGQDIAISTARQIGLQASLQLATPSYLHTPLICARDGQKLSKQNKAPAIDPQHPRQALIHAAARLGLQTPARHASITQDLQHWTQQWRQAWATGRPA